MNYVGIDWAYGRAAYCAMGDGRSRGLSRPTDGWRLVLRWARCAAVGVAAVWVRAAARGCRCGGPARGRRRSARLRRGRARVLAGFAGGLSPALAALARVGAARLLRRRRPGGPASARPDLRPAHPFGFASATRGWRPAGRLLGAAGAGGLAPLVPAARLAGVVGVARRRELRPLCGAARELAARPGVGPLLSLTLAAGRRSHASRPGSWSATPGSPRGGRRERSATGALSSGHARSAGRVGPPHAWRPSDPARPLPAVSARHGTRRVGGRPSFVAACLLAPRPSPPRKLLRFLTARRSCMELRPRGSSQERSAPRAPKMSPTHPPAGSGARTPITAGRSPPRQPGRLQREASGLTLDSRFSRQAKAKSWGASTSGAHHRHGDDSARSGLPAATPRSRTIRRDGAKGRGG